MSKLHDDLIAEIEPSGSVEESVNSAFRAIADRIEGCHGDSVKLSDLCSILREDNAKVANAMIANTPEARANPTRSVSYDAPSPAFDRPRQDVRPGMVDSPNDHREQVSPETANTETQRAQLAREQTARDRGQTLAVTEPLPPVTPAKEDKPADKTPAKAPA